MVLRFKERSQQFRLDDIQTLIGPQGFEKVDLVARLLRIEASGPAFKCRQHILLAAFLEDAPGKMARPVFRVTERVEQMIDGRTDELRLLHEGTILDGDAP